jgi:hypothetical protein
VAIVFAPMDRPGFFAPGLLHGPNLRFRRRCRLRSRCEPIRGQNRSHILASETPGYVVRPQPHPSLFSQSPPARVAPFILHLNGTL